MDDPPKTLSSRFQTLSQLQPVEPPQDNAYTTRGGCRRPRLRGGRKTAFSRQSGETSRPESFYWHPCRKSASPLSAGHRAMHEIRTARWFIKI